MGIKVTDLDYLKTLDSENTKLKEEVRQLKFRIADEQDEQNRIKIELHNQINKLKEQLDNYQEQLLNLVQTPKDRSDNDE